MISKPISLSLTILSVTALGWAVACSSSTSGNNGNPSNSNTNSNTSSTSNSTVGNNSSSHASETTSGSNSGNNSSSTNGGSAFSVGFNATSGNQISWAGVPSGDVAGYWYTYVSGNTAGDEGTVTIPGGESSTDGGHPPFTYTTIGSGGDAGISALPADAGTGTLAACISGMTPVAQYASAAEGFYFAGVPNGAAADAGNTKTFVDLSSYTGIQFWLYNASSTPLSLSFQMSDQESQPDGGICGLDGSADNACNSPPLAGGGPNGLSMVMPGWNYFQEPFAALVVNQYYGYGDMNTTGAMGRTLDTAKVYDVQWQVNQELAADAGGAAVAFSFCISDISLYK